jgi:hypothetical protein
MTKLAVRVDVRAIADPQHETGSRPSRRVWDAASGCPVLGLHLEGDLVTVVRVERSVDAAGRSSSHAP